MEKPLRSPDYTKQIRELVDQYRIKLIGSSYGADMWDKDKHNHTYEVENGMYDLRGTLKRIPDVKLGPDLNWLLRAGVNPLDFLREFRCQIIFTHLRDQLNNGKWPESIGEGNVNFREISDVMNEIGFQGDVVIELAHENAFVRKRPLKESLKMSRDYLIKNMNI